MAKNTRKKTRLSSGERSDPLAAASTGQLSGAASDIQKDEGVPEAAQGSGLYRTVFQVTVLSERPVSDLELADVAHEIVDGDASGKVEVTDGREISRRDMALALQEQGSHPGFLLGEDDGWKYGLHGGDEVTWNDPDDGKCSRTGVIGSIEYIAGDRVRITWKDGGEVEALIEELS
jgi:hypothetical protein